MRRKVTGRSDSQNHTLFSLIAPVSPPKVESLYMQFPTTRWSLIGSAGTEKEIGRKALEDLCGVYWPPLFAYARSRGFSVPDSEDLTQGFLLSLIERQSLENFVESDVRFRSFLLRAFQNHMSSEWRRELAQCRDRRKLAFSIDDLDGERWFELADDRALTPEQVFERSWANAVLENTIEKLRTVYRDRDREALFGALVPFLDAKQNPDYQQTATTLNLGIPTVRVYVSRIRAEFRDTIREEISDTLTAGADIEEELKALQASFLH